MIRTVRSALSHRWRAAAAALGLTALTLTWLALPRDAHADQPSAAVSVETFTEADRAAALRYWTPQRMRKTGEANPVGDTGPLTRTWTGRPMTPVGRLFFVNSRGDDTYCTATAVQGAIRDLVITAGHCVWAGASPSNPYLSLVFVPGYDRGARPHGAFPVRAILAPRSWTEDSVNDVAMAVVDPVGGRHLADVVTAQPVRLGAPVGGGITAFGYPASRPQLGESLLYCAGTAELAASSGLQRIPCDMAGGASGGPWLADFNPAAGKGTVVSVNSHGDAMENSRYMMGEVLGDGARAVYEEAQRR